VLRPHAWLMLGHCAGLRNTQKLGDYVLAHGYSGGGKLLLIRGKKFQRFFWRCTWSQLTPVLYGWPILSPGRVGAVDYSGPAGGLVSFDEACAVAIEKCTTKP